MPKPSVLVVADFTGNLGKVERHVGPLARVAEPTVVCVNAPDDVEGVRFVTSPAVGFRPLDLLVMGFVALLEGIRGNYDAVASFSLLPHGIIALATARLAGGPAHLGIIGGDVDLHARARYGPAIRWLFRRFDVVSVPGTAYRDELVEFGVDPDRVAILVNPIPTDEFEPPNPAADRPIDYLWVGRLGAEKDPLLFVETVARLHEEGGRSDADARSDDGADPHAVLVGDGPMRDVVAAAVRELDLTDVVTLTGWVDEPGEYYRRARTFVLTSRREALPLTLLEAMACGAVPVVPEVGNVRDVVAGDRGVVVDDRTAAALAGAIRDLERDPDRLAAMAERAPAVRERYSYRSASEDWRRVLARAGLDVPEQERATPA